MFGIHTLIQRQLNAFEQQYQYDMGYTRQILASGLKNFRAFSGVFKLASQREAVPFAPWLAAKWVATHSEDCGPCQQLLIDMGLQEGVPTQVIRAMTEGDLNTMPADVALVYQWASSVIRPAHVDDADALREQVLAKWGERGLVSLALAMAGARSFPMIKRALGHQKSCQRLSIGDA